MIHTLRSGSFLNAEGIAGDPEANDDEPAPGVKHAYDPVKMVKKQKKNFMINTIVCLITQVLVVAYSIASMLMHESVDEFFAGDCLPGGYEMRDSGLHMVLTNILICAPIWQFIECFYAIPLHHGFFNDVLYKKDEFQKQSDTELGETKNTNTVN